MFKINKNSETTGKWYREDHVLEDDTYRCSVCGSVFKKKQDYCPQCHTHMTKEEYIPTAFDEMERMDD